MNNWPTQQDIHSGTSIYGNPVGKGGEASRTWETNQMVLINPAFPLRMGAIVITRMRVNKACAQSLATVFRNLFSAARGDLEQLRHWGVTEFGGVYNYRPMRGLSALSMHAYACAIDLDPARNALGNRDPRFAKFPEVLAAFKDEGWRWGGDWDGDGQTRDESRCDGMHWQATK